MNNIGKSEDYRQRTEIWSLPFEIPISRSRNSCGRDYNSPENRPNARFLHRHVVRVYSCKLSDLLWRETSMHMRVRVAGGYTLLIVIHVDFLNIRLLSSSFSLHLRRLLNFTPLSWRYQQVTCLSRASWSKTSG